MKFPGRNGKVPLAQEILPLEVLYHLERLEVLEVPKQVDWCIISEENVTMPQIHTECVFITHWGAKFSNTRGARWARPALETNVTLQIQVCTFKIGKLRGPAINTTQDSIYLWTRKSNSEFPLKTRRSS